MRDMLGETIVSLIDILQVALTTINSSIPYSVIIINVVGIIEGKFEAYLPQMLSQRS